MNKIEEYNEFAINLYEDWGNDLISDEEYQNQYHDWLMENGSDELFDYLLNRYTSPILQRKFKNLQSEFHNQKQLKHMKKL